MSSSLRVSKKERSADPTDLRKRGQDYSSLPSARICGTCGSGSLSYPWRHQTLEAAGSRFSWAKKGTQSRHRGTSRDPVFFPVVSVSRWLRVRICPTCRPVRSILLLTETQSRDSSLTIPPLSDPVTSSILALAVPIHGLVAIIPPWQVVAVMQGTPEPPIAFGQVQR